jgi:hypothetical protein
VIWGGCASLNTQCFSPGDGAVYTVGADKTWSWRPIPPSPVRTAIGESGTTAGNELVVWGGNGAAAYDPSSDTWHRLQPPVADRDHAATATDGRRAYFYGGQGANANPRDGAIYDPAENRWTDIPAGPAEAQAATWAANELVAVAYDEVGAYDPDTKVWRRLPPSPLGPRDNMAVVGTPSQVLLFGGGAGGSLTDPNDGAIYRFPSRCPTAAELSARANARPTVVTITEAENPIEGVHLDVPPPGSPPPIDAATASARARRDSRADPGPSPTVSLGLLTDSTMRGRLAWVLIYAGAVTGRPTREPSSPPPCYVGTTLIAVDAVTGSSLGEWLSGAPGQ